MPRRRLADIEETAKAAGVAPPKRGNRNPPPSPLQMALRRQAMIRLLSMNATDDDIVSAMTENFPGISPESIGRLRKEAKAEIEKSIHESVVYEGAKQRTRMIRHIARADAKGQHSAAIAGERLYAEIVGTIKPQVVNHNHTLVPAFQTAIARLSGEQLEALASGKDVPLGGVIETTAEPKPEGGDAD